MAKEDVMGENQLYVKQQHNHKIPMNKLNQKKVLNMKQTEFC